MRKRTRSAHPEASVVAASAEASSSSVGCIVSGAVTNSTQSPENCGSGTHFSTAKPTTVSTSSSRESGSRPAVMSAIAQIVDDDVSRDLDRGLRRSSKRPLERFSLHLSVDSRTDASDDSRVLTATAAIPCRYVAGDDHPVVHFARSNGPEQEHADHAWNHDPGEPIPRPHRTAPRESTQKLEGGAQKRTRRRRTRDRGLQRSRS